MIWTLFKQRQPALVTSAYIHERAAIDCADFQFSWGRCRRLPEPSGPQYQRQVLDVLRRHPQLATRENKGQVLYRPITEEVHTREKMQVDICNKQEASCRDSNAHHDCNSCRVGAADSGGNRSAER